MHSWPSRYYGYVLRDALLNLLLYIPLGVCACMVFRRRMQPAPAAALAVLVGFLLSSAIEIAQAYEATRDSSLMDITTNTAGSAVGALLAAVFSHQAHSHRMKAIDPTAATLFALWLISLLFPFVPEHSFAILVNKLNAFWTFSPVAFTSAVLGWYLAGTLLSEAGAPNATVWIFASTLLTPLQMLISPHQPTAAMLFGAIAGAVLFTFLRGRENPKLLALALVLLLVLHGAAPFVLASHANQFNWNPFADFFESNWQRNGSAFIEKAFYCTAAVWALRRAELRLSTAVLALAALLSVVECIQIWLPGRAPGVTDPLLPFISGIVLDTLSRPQTNFQPLRNFGFR